MNRDRVYLEDIVDVEPIVNVSDELVDRCRIAFEATDHDLFQRDSIHDWVVTRALADDRLVSDAMRALFARDCAWGVADLDHSPKERYLWELTAEIAREPRDSRWMWSKTLGSFESCGQTFEVSIHRPAGRSSKIPHMHVRMVHQPVVPDVCVAIFEPVYVPNGLRRWGFDDRHREDFANYMWRLDSFADPWPIWHDIEGHWLDICQEEGIEPPDYPHMGDEHTFPVPDYHMLHWPGDDGTRS